MALVDCEECGRQIASNARVCPYCGRKRTHPFVMGCAVFLIGVLILIILNATHAMAALENYPRHRHVTPIQRAAAGAMVLRRLMVDPESFRLDSALIADGTGAVCYRYLARNTLGQMAWGLAMLEPDGKFMTSEAKVFHEEWKKMCAGRSGQDIAKSIQWIKS